jgi:uncharacterized membrane protein YgcG
MKTVVKCPKCQYLGEFRHEHDAAHGIEGTHMEGTERFICSQCGHTVTAQSRDAHLFTFILDGKRSVPRHDDPPKKNDDDGGASAALLGGVAGAVAAATLAAEPAEAKPAEPPPFSGGGGDTGGAGASASFDPPADMSGSGAP